MVLYICVKKRFENSETSNFVVQRLFGLPSLQSPFSFSPSVGLPLRDFVGFSYNRAGPTPPSKRFIHFLNEVGQKGHFSIQF